MDRFCAQGPWAGVPHHGRCGRPGRPAASEPEAGHAARLRPQGHDRRAWLNAVHVPRRWSLQRRVERGSDARPALVGLGRQPPSAHALATRASAPGSVTRTASPSKTTSASRTDSATEHRGSRATLRPLRVPAPVWNQDVPSSHTAPTAVTCGLPSSLTVQEQAPQAARRRLPGPPTPRMPLGRRPRFGELP